MSTGVIEDLFGKSEAPTGDPERSQWFTPAWAACALVEEYFGDLTSKDVVLEPSCGTGAFLGAIPPNVGAIGVEIDPGLAEIARRSTGRQVVVGDFRTVDLPVQPTAMVGNPPFTVPLIEAFLDRAHALLPDGGRAGLILPCYSLQSPSTVERFNARWSIAQDLLPRTLFPRLSLPLCFAVFTRGRSRGMVGFRLYHEAAAVSRLQARYAELLRTSTNSVWVAVTRAALEALGGSATLPAIYREIEGHRPTTNAFWKPKVRQTLQRIAVRTGPGAWALPTARAA